MTILKDATTAIYGINGSSGVVIITTKRGKANKPQLNFNAYWGVSKL
jgi:TonB-dependent SusC/RagA subfamily outer membrane receptor